MDPRNKGMVASRFSRAGTVLSWTVVSLVPLVLLSVVVTLVGRTGLQPPFLTTQAERRAPVRVEPHAHGSDLLHIAGSGSNLPLTRALADAFTQRHGGRIIVYESIGSRGAIRATQDGVIELGLVSRALGEEERLFGLDVIPYARTPVVVAVHTSVPDDEIDLRRLVAIYGGDEQFWSDGSRIAVLQREPGDSSHEAIARLQPEFAEVNDVAYRENRWRVLHTDAAMQEALIGTAGAVGLYGHGRVPRDMPIKALRMEGVEPSLASLRDGSYPVTKDFAFVSRGRPDGLAGEFVRFVLSDDGRAMIVELGYMPLERGEK